MTTDTEALRAQFEAWFSGSFPACSVERNVDGEYKYMPANAAWQTYQAAQPAPQPAAVAVPSGTPEGWRDKFAEAVYVDLEAADTQDVPLEEYPTRISKVLDSVVGPRHPTVIHWRNDAIQACIAIAYKYCRDPETFQYLKQDLQALIFAAPTTQPDTDHKAIGRAAGFYAGTGVQESWLDFQAGYAAAKAETADVAAKEREHCALVCEDVRRAVAEINGSGVAAAQQCADAIRAGATERGE